MRLGARLLIVMAVGAAACPLVGQTTELPQISTTNFLPVIRQQIEQAYEAARANSRSAKTLGKLGMILDAYEQYESAAVCYQRARLLDPVSFRWAYYLGWVQAAQGKYAEAVATLNEALRLNPTYLPAQLRLAESLLAVGKWEKSSEIYKSVSKEYPECALAFYGLGRVYAARGEANAAVESLRKACDLFPPYGAAHYALALAYRKLGASEKAREHFNLCDQTRTAAPSVEDPLRNAVSGLNRGPQARIRRGVALEQAGKLQEAIAEHEEALRAEPQQVQVHINLISLYGRVGEFTKAEEHYRAAVNLNPNQADAYYNYGVLLTRQKKNPEAEQAFRRALQINPLYAEAQNNLANLYEQQGRIDEALRNYQEAITNRPNYRLAHFHVGRILVNQNKYDEAIQHFLKTLEPEDENTPGYLYALAATYARAGNRESALRYARKAREEATARGQTQLLLSIERDFDALEKSVPTDK